MPELRDGILSIYEKVASSENGTMPTYTLSLYRKAWFGYLGFFSSEFYAARQAQISVEKKVKILQDKSITNQHVILIDDVQYDVGRVDHGNDKNGIPLTFITLERTTQKYDVK